jgi:heptosyltransferase-3
MRDGGPDVAAAQAAFPRILVIRLRRLGDTLLTTPAIRAIRKAYPQCQLDVAVAAGFESALHANPDIDRVLVVRRGRRAVAPLLAVSRARYDMVLDVQSSMRSALLALVSRAPMRVGWRKHRVRDQVYTHLVSGWDERAYFARKMLRAAAAIGVPPSADVRPQLAVREADQEHAAKLCAAVEMTARHPVVALSVVANAPSKQWPPERFAALADQLVETHFAQVILTHGPGQLEQVRSVVACMRRPPALWNYGDTTLSELAALYQRCDLWIGNDGGPKHVATAVGCPTVTIIHARDVPVWIDSEDARQVAVPAPALDGHVDSLDGVGVDDVWMQVCRLLGC